MELAYLSEEQNLSFDYQYHGEEELAAKIGYLRSRFPDGPRRVLDIGGGNGKFMDRLLAEFPAAQGVVLDISQQLLALNAPNSRKTLVHGSITDLQSHVGDGNFDVITINWVLHHLVGPSYQRSLDNIREALDAAAALLSSRGIIYVAENEIEGFFETNIPSRLIYGITRIRSPGFVRLARPFFNTAGVGVCFQSKRGWFEVFARSRLAVAKYIQHDRWDRGPLRRLMFAALFLKHQKHGHFALERR